MPKDAGQVEEDCLQEEDEGYPLVIGYYLLGVVGFRDVIFKWEVICIPNPTIRGGIFHLCISDVDRGPAGDRVANVLMHAHSNGKDHQYYH